jgi:hypothetical protein
MADSIIYVEPEILWNAAAGLVTWGEGVGAKMAKSGGEP